MSETSFSGILYTDGMRPGITFSIVLALGIGAFVIVQLLPKDEPTTTTVNGNVVSGTARAVLLGRDNHRISDIRTLQVALASYRETSSEDSYPTTLDGLVPQFFAAVPRDPKSGEPFSYTPLGSQYRLSFTLEIGTGGFSAGEHIASPGGIQ